MMKSAKIMKIVPSDIVKMVRHAVAKAAPDHLNIVFDVLKKKTRACGCITVNYYRSLLHLPQSFTKLKKPCNVSSSSLATYDACSSCNNDDDSISPVSTFILKRINEDAPNLDQEIDRLADDFIASFHATFRLEKQQSYRQYQEMLARST
uniref:Uncharacterized protein n=1 Tax=Picea sitchensis TaxID=3332 RepID=A9P068_PICSI|nr:unknown [Picea sitchensis]